MGIEGFLQFAFYSSSLKCSKAREFINLDPVYRDNSVREGKIRKVKPYLKIGNRLVISNFENGHRTFDKLFQRSSGDQTCGR